MHFTILLEVPANGGYLGRNLILVIGAYMAAENASQLIGIVTLLAVIFVLVLSNILISAVRNLIPKKVRIVCFIAINHTR